MSITSNQKPYEHSTAFSSDVLAQAASLKIVDQAGKAVTFGSLFETQRTIVVFIRHFGCSRCQDYCTELNKVRDEALGAANSRLVIIGIGEPALIPAYYETTGLRNTVIIYTDSSRSLPQLFGFSDTLEGAAPADPKRAYVTDTHFGAIWKWIKRSPWMTPSHLFMTGPDTQNGGEMVLGPGLNCSFAHRMKTSTDHLDIDELMKEAGVAYP